MNINVSWHQKNKMPKNPTKEQRLRWHVTHAQNCQCRKMSDKLAAEIKEYNKSL